jgi:ATP-dependent Clp protease ATP-binding subunit ClpC
MMVGDRSSSTGAKGPISGDDDKVSADSHPTLSSKMMGHYPGPMFERFTDRARRVLVLAQEEARRLTHPYIGTEHLLLGLILERDGIAAQVLGHHGITLEVARSAVEEAIEAPASVLGGSPPFTTRAKKVLELSLRESMQLGHLYIGPEHILLGLIREGEGGGATVILSLGANFGELRDEVIALTPESGEEGEPTGQERPLREEAPNCPRCGAGLAEEARYRLLDVPPQHAGPDDVILSIPILFCNRCGRAFGALT